MLSDSTETVVLYVHDHLINATGSRKISYLCHLDLSAALDVIDHNILPYSIVCLLDSVFMALIYTGLGLSSRCFSVHAITTSPLYTLVSVLGPLLFVMYATPLSTLISSLSLNQHLYVDDTQLFFPSIHQNSILISTLWFKKKRANFGGL